MIHIHRCATWIAWLPSTLYGCIWSTRPLCRLGPNQCHSHLATQKFLFWFSHLPGLSDLVSALINSGATSNFLDSSLATCLPCIWTLDHLINCASLMEPATVGSSHSLWISLSICWPLNPVSLSPGDKLHLLLWSSLASLAVSTNLMIDWLVLSLPSNRSRSALPLLALAWDAQQMPTPWGYYFWSLPCFWSILNFVLLKDFDLTKVSWSQNQHFCQLGFLANLHPLEYLLGTDLDLSHELMHLWDPLSPWFSAWTHSPGHGGVPTPAMIFLVVGRSCYNQLSLGVPPEHGYVNPCKLRSPLANQKVSSLQHGQLSSMSSQGVSQPDQHCIRSSQGHPHNQKVSSLHPGQLSQSVRSPSQFRRYQALQHGNSPPCQVRAVSSTHNTPLGPSGSILISSQVPLQHRFV